LIFAALTVFDCFSQCIFGQGYRIFILWTITRYEGY